MRVASCAAVQSHLKKKLRRDVALKLRAIYFSEKGTKEAAARAIDRAHGRLLAIEAGPE